MLENTNRLYSERQAEIVDDLGNGYFLGDDSYDDDDGFVKAGYSVYYQEGPDQYRHVGNVSMSPYSNPRGHVENEIKKLSVDNGKLQSYIRTIDSDNRNLRQSTQAQRTETRTSQNTQGPVDKRDDNTKLASDPEVECVICMAPLTDGHPVSVTPCRHRFHTACIEYYINVRSGTAHCPHCRGNIPGVSSLTPQAQWIEKNPYMKMFSQFAVYIDK